MGIPSKHTYPDFRVNQAGVDRGMGWDISWRRRKNQFSPINLGLIMISISSRCVSINRKLPLNWKGFGGVEISYFESL